MQCLLTNCNLVSHKQILGKSEFKNNNFHLIKMHFKLSPSTCQPFCSDLIALFHLWLIDTIWRHRSGSTLVQVKAWCLKAPSHLLEPMFYLWSERPCGNHMGENFMKCWRYLSLVWVWKWPIHDYSHISLMPMSFNSGPPVFMPAGPILGLRPVNERRPYKVTASFIGWAQT